MMDRKKAMGLFFGLLSLAAACFLAGCATDGGTQGADIGPWQEGAWENPDDAGTSVLVLSGEKVAYFRIRADGAERFGWDGTFILTENEFQVTLTDGRGVVWPYTHSGKRFTLKPETVNDLAPNSMNGTFDKISIDPADFIFGGTWVRDSGGASQKIAFTGNTVEYTIDNTPQWTGIASYNAATAELSVTDASGTLVLVTTVLHRDKNLYINRPIVQKDGIEFNRGTYKKQ